MAAVPYSERCALMMLGYRAGDAKAPLTNDSDRGTGTVAVECGVGVAAARGARGAEETGGSGNRITGRNGLERQAGEDDGRKGETTVTLTCGARSCGGF